MPDKPIHVLISPLDWGLGHAARCIPVIQHFLASGHRVSLAGSGRSLLMLQKAFPELECFDLQGFSPSYASSGNTLWHLFLLLPRFLFSIPAEHRALKKAHAAMHFDLVVSDNRYGLWHPSIRSVIITHQVMIKTPGWLKFADYLFYRISRMLLQRFDACWIPDYALPPGLSGDLAHKYRIPRNAKFLGPLTRFGTWAPLVNKQTEIKKIIAIISGPEPQRSIFEEILVRQLSQLGTPALLIGGKPESENPAAQNNKLQILPYLSTEALGKAIQEASIVICRPGYSSIMDLQALGAKALFVPTPGQTEQEYLAGFYQQLGIALWRPQNKLNLASDLEEAGTFSGFQKIDFENKFESAIASIQKK